MLALLSAHVDVYEGDGAAGGGGRGFQGWKLCGSDEQEGCLEGRLVLVLVLSLAEALRLHSGSGLWYSPSWALVPDGAA